MRNSKTCIVILLILLFSGEVMAGGYSVSGVGLRALSMGGAFRAVADDWSAIYYNPAGLTGLYQNEIAFGIDFYSNRHKFNPDVSMNGYTFGYYDGEDRVHRDRLVYTPYAGGVALIPLFENVCAGIGIFQPFDWNVEWDVFRLSPSYNPYVEDSQTVPVLEPLVPFPRYTHTLNLDAVDFHPTVAVELMEDKLSLGLGASIVKGSYYRDEIILVPNTLEEAYSSRPYDNLVQRTELSATGWGFGFNVGLLYHYNDQWSFGASYQSKVKLDLDGTVNGFLYAPGNRYIADMADTSHVASELFNGEVYQAEHEAETEWTIPSQLGFGASYQVNEKIMLTGDFAYTFWSDYEDIEIDVISSSGLTNYAFINGLLMPQNFINRWDDAFRISIGIEAQPHEKYKLRGGYSYDQSPISEDGSTVVYGNPADHHHITGGASFYVGIIEFFGAAELIFAPETTSEGMTDYDGDGVYDTQAGTYKGTTFVTSIGFTVRF